MPPSPQNPRWPPPVPAPIRPPGRIPGSQHTVHNRAFASMLENIIKGCTGTPWHFPRIFNPHHHPPSLPTHPAFLFARSAAAQRVSADSVASPTASGAVESCRSAHLTLLQTPTISWPTIVTRKIPPAFSQHRNTLFITATRYTSHGRKIDGPCSRRREPRRVAALVVVVVLITAGRRAAFPNAAVTAHAAKH
jgi:hypothetical protein